MEWYHRSTHELLEGGAGVTLRIDKLSDFDQALEEGVKNHIPSVSSYSAENDVRALFSEAIRIFFNKPCFFEHPVVYRRFQIRSVQPLPKLRVIYENVLQLPLDIV